MLARRLVPLSCVALVASLLPAVASADEPGGGDTVVAVDQATAAPVASDARGIIVGTESGVQPSAVGAAAEDALAGEAEVIATDAVTSGIVAVELDRTLDEDAAADVAAEIAERPDVEWAIPNLRVTAQATSPVRPNDPKFSQQYQLWDSRTSARRATTLPWGGYSSKAPAVWRKTTGSSDVVVAVVDTGITAHPDLAANVVPGYDMIDADQGPNRYYTANDGNGRDSDPSDPGDWIPKGDTLCYGKKTTALEPSSWHGTHVAGIVAAASNNGVGVSGVAPGVKIQPVRVLGRCGGYTLDILLGILWAGGVSIKARYGIPDNATPAKVVNVSLGTTVTAKTRAQVCEAYTSVARQVAAKGATIVAAAGNESRSASYSVPAVCDGYLSVAATSEYGYRAFYSNYGASVDLSAPGGDSVLGDHGIVSTVNSGTTSPGSASYAGSSWQGTSMAAPVVSGGAALLYSLGYTSPGKVKAALKASVSRFAPYLSDYRDVVLRSSSGSTLRAGNLNCTTSTCGTGVLDLSRIPIPLSAPAPAGSPIVNAVLTAKPGRWYGKPSGYAYQWLRDGAAITAATSATYRVSSADLGHALSVRIRPSASAFASSTMVSAATAKVATGPAVSLEGPTSLRYGTAANLSVTSAVDGTVRLMRGTTELAHGTVVSGTATLRVPGTSWGAGSNAVHAIVLDDADSVVAASPARSVTVYRAVPTLTKLTMGSTVDHTGNGTMWARVYVPGVTHPRGTFGVYDGSRRIQTATIAANANGIKKITLPKLATGKHVLTVKFLGTDLVAPKTSARKTVTSR